MHTCRNCGYFVTPDFARVFGTTENEVLRCPSCAEMTEIKAGSGALPDAQRSTRWNG